MFYFVFFLKVLCFFIVCVNLELRLPGLAVSTCACLISFLLISIFSLDDVTVTENSLPLSPDLQALEINFSCVSYSFSGSILGLRFYISRKPNLLFFFLEYKQECIVFLLRQFCYSCGRVLIDYILRNKPFTRTPRLIWMLLLLFFSLRPSFCFCVSVF